MIFTRLFSLSTIALQVHGNFLTKQPEKKKKKKKKTMMMMMMVMMEKGHDMYV